ncbi:uncharacterized protein LOC134468524 [Engraulis encrasicolus]|uniref:uncharacterized protein LOC134468524 n=1 Tax=Engraulis encrasicolus TaxID=184585 RepID=UPI002FD700D9
MVNTRGKASCAEILTDIETLSLSSEEGMYTLSPLDSEEEEAYKYILALEEEANRIPRPDVTALPPVKIAIEHLSHTPHHTHCICQHSEQANPKNGNKRISGHEETALPEANGHTTTGDHQDEDTHHGSSTSVLSMEYDCGQNISAEPARPRDTTADTNECSNVQKTDREEDMSLKREDALPCPSDSQIEERLFPESDSTVDTVDSQGSSHSNGIRATDEVEDEDQTTGGMAPHQLDTGRVNAKIGGESELTPEAQGGSSIEVESLRGTVTAVHGRDTTSDTKEYSNAHVQTETEGEDIPSSITSDNVILDHAEVSHGGAIKAKYDLERDQPANSIESHSVDNSKCNDGRGDVDYELTPHMQVDILLEVESLRGTNMSKDTIRCTTEYPNTIHSNADEEDMSECVLDEGLCPDSESGFERQDLTLDVIDPDDISQNVVVEATDEVEKDQTVNLIESHPTTYKGSLNCNTEGDTELNPQTQGDDLPSEQADIGGMVMARDTMSETEEFPNEHTDEEEEVSVREDVSSSPLNSKVEESLFLDPDSGLEPHGSATDSLDPDVVSHYDTINAKHDTEYDQTANSNESHSRATVRFNGTAETHRDSSSEEEAITTCNANSDLCSEAHSYIEEAVSQRREHIVSSPSDSEVEESLSLDSDPADDVEGDQTTGQMSYQTDNGPLDDCRPTENTELSPQTQGVSSLEGEESLKQKDLCGKYSGHVPHTQIGLSVDREAETMREKDACDISCLDGQVLQREVVGRGGENQEEPDRWYERSLLPDEDTAQVNAHPTRERELSSASVDLWGALDAKELNLLLYLWLFTYCFFVIRHGICKYFTDVLK